jgi:Ca-activated chloride channel family protein
LKWPRLTAESKAAGELAGAPATRNVGSQLGMSKAPQAGRALPAISADFAVAPAGGIEAIAYRERQEPWNTESYDPIEETGFRSPLVAPLSTFSIDVDTAGYANVRRFLNNGQLPPADAVRIEELINYFPYDDAAPTRSLDEGGNPFAVHMDLTTAPWNTAHHLLRVALKGYEMPWEERPSSNLVFLLDVSGSMNSPNKLPLVKDAMRLLVDRLDARDRVAIVVYAGASGLVLPSTTANNHETVFHAIQNLAAGGSTNAGAGIELAYKVARDHFIKGGNNRVILCTDGDFNVGLTNRGELAGIVSEQAEAGVSLTILGFGMGNYKDDMLETLSNKGKGSYAYIDSGNEAKKVFLEEIASNLFKIAKDVKIQVEFNPAHVGAYRLIGYENRRLKAEDFNDDQKKAGDIGPGHSVVALYEIVPPKGDVDLPTVDPLKYQNPPSVDPRSDELATVKLRYKQPEGTTSRLITETVRLADRRPLASASDDVRFGAAVAAFGMRLSGSELPSEYAWQSIEDLARSAVGADGGHYRTEFLQLVRKARDLEQAQSTPQPRPQALPEE